MRVSLNNQAVKQQVKKSNRGHIKNMNYLQFSFSFDFGLGIEPGLKKSGQEKWIFF